LSYAEEVYARRTVIIYRLVFKRFQAITGNCPLSSLNLHHFDRYKIERLKCKGRNENFVSPVTLNIELRALKAAFNIAVRWKLLIGNPFLAGRLAMTEENIPVYIKKEHFQMLISMIKEKWLREIVVFAGLTGMRRGEIVHLRWQDVDLQRKLIYIQSSTTFRTKQGKRRTIPMNNAVFQLLTARFGLTAGDYIFTLHGRRVEEEWVTHRFKQYVVKAGLNDKIHFHSLRHTFATWLVQDGVSIYEVQKLLGHSSVKVTEVYSHLAASELHNAVNKINLSFN
jgi:site-specific recombinase XerD